MYRLLLISFYLFIVDFLSGQSVTDVVVDVSAVVNTNGSITLSWTGKDDATAYEIHRKSLYTDFWSNKIATLTGTATSYTDANFVDNNFVEYRVTRRTPTLVGYGYIHVGAQMSLKSSHGKVILVIANNIVDSLRSEIAQFSSDLEGDGWFVLPLIVDIENPASSIKTEIAEIYNKDKTNTTALILLGHIPVPYSGVIAPDGHQPDHLGAWPSDVYYADIEKNWTDNTANNSSSNNPRTNNVPGDGKFDFTTILNAPKLMTGRIDMYDLPKFNRTEISLLRDYLIKNHNYRHGIFKARDRAIIDDNFGYFSGEAFSQGAWRSFTAICGRDSVFAGDYFTELNNGSYKWSYGCGGGWYEGAGGVGETQNFVDGNVQGVFTQLFGSYFGDWDTRNNFMRASLAKGTNLTVSWSGRPVWMLHHMAMGKPIGLSTIISQYYSGNYSSSFGSRMVHVALLGDPTLRAHVVEPPQSLVVVNEGNENKLSWTAPTEPIDRYRIIKYLKSEPYQIAGSEEIEGSITTYVDSCILDPNTYVYQVKSVKLQVNPSGSYFNTSQGISGSVTTTIDYTPVADASYIANQNKITFENKSKNASGYIWDFGDGNTSTEENPIHVYASTGNYTIKLIVENPCLNVEKQFNISILSNTINEEVKGVKIFPNPAKQIAHLDIHESINIDRLTLTDIFGREMPATLIDQNKFNVQNIPSGLYIVKIFTGSNGTLLSKLIVE
jgi:hypothetical protein